MIKQDEREFFMKNVIPHYETLVKNLAYISNDIHLANDIAQDLMIDTLNSIERVKKYENIVGYLIDAGKKKIKKHFREHNMFESIDNVTNNIPTEKTIEEILIKVEMGAEVIEAVEMLDEKYKRVVTLHYYHDMPLKEIANTLDKNYSTVRSLHIRALDSLKAFYDANEKLE